MRKLVNVAVGSKAALTAPKTDFRFTPESGLKSDIAPCPKSANTGSRGLIRSPQWRSSAKSGGPSGPTLLPF
jgi:hypothetical protein